VQFLRWDWKRVERRRVKLVFQVEAGNIVLCLRIRWNLSLINHEYYRNNY